MKKGFIYLLLLSGIVTLFSCEDTDYQIYDKNQKNKLFFAEDSLQFTYGLTRDQDVDLNVEVGLIGFVDLSSSRPGRGNISPYLWRIRYLRIPLLHLYLWIFISLTLKKIKNMC